MSEQYLKTFYKTVFCPKKHRGMSLSYDQVRALTIGKSRCQSEKGGYVTNDPRRWLPPETAITKLAHLFQLQIDYIGTAGNHSAIMPDFLKSDCLIKHISGEVEYYFGQDAHFNSLEELPAIDNLPKRRINSTPQKGARKTRQMTSTPKSKLKKKT